MMKKKKISIIFLIAIMLAFGVNTVALADDAYYESVCFFGYDNYYLISYDYAAAATRGRNFCTTHTATNPSKWRVCDTGDSSSTISDDYWHSAGTYNYDYDYTFTGYACLFVRLDSEMVGYKTLGGTWRGKQP